MAAARGRRGTGYVDRPARRLGRGAHHAAAAAAGERSRAEQRISGHAGDGILHVVLRPREERDLQAFVPAAVRCITALRAAAAALGGSWRTELAPTVEVWSRAGADPAAARQRLFDRFRAAADPEGIFSPNLHGPLCTGDGPIAEPGTAACVPQSDELTVEGEGTYRPRPVHYLEAVPAGAKFSARSISRDRNACRWNVAAAILLEVLRRLELLVVLQPVSRRRWRAFSGVGAALGPFFRLVTKKHRRGQRWLQLKRLRSRT